MAKDYYDEVIGPTEVEQLRQLLRVTWDGDLISKLARGRLVKNRLADRAHGCNFITAKGLRFLKRWGFLPDMSTHWDKMRRRAQERR